MKRKALFFDIDGTLLSDHKKELPESAARVIAQARRAGHLVFINSGRARCLMQEVEAALPVDGYLCGCGTYLEIQGKKVLHHVIGRERRLEPRRASWPMIWMGSWKGRRAVPYRARFPGWRRWSGSRSCL